MASAVTHRRYKYFPSLDIVRFVAFMLVFVSHASLFFGYHNDSAGWVQFREIFLTHGDLGVTFFFVLSGFLITYLLMSERHQNGVINIKKFYMRRLLRIWPLYFITLIIATVFLPYFVGIMGVKNTLPFDVFQNLNNYPWYVFFLGNFNMFVGGGAPAVTLAVLWSISVEEQFYLLWPLAIKTIKKRYLPWILSTVVILATVYRFVYANDYSTVKYSTFSVMSDIAIGCMVAWLFFEKSRLTLWAKNLSHVKAFFLYYSSLTILILSRSFIYDVQIEWVKRILIGIEPVIFAILFACIISRLAGLRDDFITGKHPVQKMFVYLGQISYGLYCYHMIVLVLILTAFSQAGYSIVYSSIPQMFAVFFLTLVVTIIFAMVSYHFIERKILKLKNKYH